jgi:hypothetical protein
MKKGRSMKRNAVLFLVIVAVMCFARPVGAAFTNLLQDPGFEAGIPNSYWAETSTNFGTPLCNGSCGGVGPRTGSIWCWFGGTSNYEAGSLSQTVTIPTGAAKLEFYLWVSTTSGDTADVVNVDMDNDTVFSANATQNSLYPAYTLVSVDVSSYADNASHTLLFASVTNGQTVNFHVDDVALLSEPMVNLIVAKAGTGTGTVTSADGKINCGSDCTEPYLQGTVVKLTAAAALGSTFTGWSGGGCSGMDNCTLTMTDNMTGNGTVTANFDIIPTTTTTAVTTTTIASACIDNDADGYGEGCAAGDDCNDDDAFYNEVCPNCEVKIIPRALGWFLGEKEKTRLLLVIGKRGTELDDSMPVRWESGDITVLSQRVFFKRFMFMKVSIDGAALEKGAYRALLGTCSATLNLAR